MRLPLLRLAFVFLALGACVGGRSAEIPGLRPAHPRLLATPDDWSRLAQRRAAEPDLAAYHEALLAAARGELAKPPATYVKTGKRLLWVSRTVLERVMVLAYAGREDEAEAVSADVRAEPHSDVGTWQIGLLRAAWRGDRGEVVRLTNGPQRATAMWDAEVPWLLAVAHAKVGLHDDALFWLGRAVDGGMINVPFFTRHDRFLDSVRDDPRFAGILARAQRAWETF